jgi:uncharacterized protein
MKFEWDEAKNLTNIRKHGFDFADAEEIFRGLVIAEPDTHEDFGEERWRGLGTIGGRIVQVVFCERASETVRIISLRKATSRESKEYAKALKDKLEAN